MNGTTWPYNLIFVSPVLSNGQEIQSIKYYMNFTNSFIYNVTIKPINGYLPAGGYKLYPHSLNFGFSYVANVSNVMMQPFLIVPTCIQFYSSFGGG